MKQSISGNIVDIAGGNISAGTVTIESGKIADIHYDDTIKEEQYIHPGFIDAHIHIESSMLIPSEFARLAVAHGTVATVSDPHEIANVLGLRGVRYMIENGKKVPFHFFFGAPSCVPATTFESAGATLTAAEIKELLTTYDLHYLSEMMNFPGVLANDPLVMEKIQVAKSLGKPIDGHAPGMRGDDAKRYIAAGISSDHECYSLEEALDKLRFGMNIIIREGSAAKNFEALHTLIDKYPDRVMFCSDDKHPNELVLGHINKLVSRAIVDKGHDTMKVLRCACLNPIAHYNLDVGMLRKGDSADFIVVDNLRNFNVKKTFIKGIEVAADGITKIVSTDAEVINNFHSYPVHASDFLVKASGKQIKIIEALDGELITNCLVEHAAIQNGFLVSSVDRDILKIAVVNRYQKEPPAVAFIRGFKLKHGALASSIAHDSHNIVVVGVDDEDLVKAVNALMEHKGGISVVSKGSIEILSLPVAGLMSHLDGYEIAKQYSAIDAKAKELGTKLHAPFMTLAFMALLVIPALKLSDKGLFDGKNFCFTPLNI